jgi:hypothetical protein
LDFENFVQDFDKESKEGIVHQEIALLRNLLPLEATLFLLQYLHSQWGVDIGKYAAIHENLSGIPNSES